jgi:proline racemase
MRSKLQFTVVDAHSAGAQARVVVGGVADVAGSTMDEKRRFLQRERDNVRKLLMYEPRGGAQMSGSILLPATDPRADLGIVFIETGGWLHLCGAGTIGAATVAIETGMVDVHEPVTRVVFDTPAGLVTAVASVCDGAVQHGLIGPKL